MTYEIKIKETMLEQTKEYTFITNEYKISNNNGRGNCMKDWEKKYQIIRFKPQYSNRNKIFNTCFAEVIICEATTGRRIEMFKKGEMR